MAEYLINDMNMILDDVEYMDDSTINRISSDIIDSNLKAYIILGE